MKFSIAGPRKERRKARVAVFTGALAFALATFAPPALHEAQACGRGGNYGLEGLAYVAGALAVTVVAVDVGFAAYDITKAAKHERGSDGMATAELLVMIPQTLVFLSIAANDKTGPSPWLALGLIPTMMTVHGVATLAAPRHDDAPSTGATSAALAGPRSLPSFGLSGAF